jgi:uncharacterized protein (TIGR00369 family)
MADMTTPLQLAQDFLKTQPFSRLLGAQITGYGQTEGAELRLDISEQVKQQHGFVHGGVLSYLADNALTFAGGTALGPAVVTSEFKINYVRPALGELLIARARVAHGGKTQAVCTCEVFVVTDGEEKLCALAQGTITLLAKPTI